MCNGNGIIRDSRQEINYFKGGVQIGQSLMFFSKVKETKLNKDKDTRKNQLSPANTPLSAIDLQKKERSLSKSKLKKQDFKY